MYNVRLVTARSTSEYAAPGGTESQEVFVPLEMYATRMAWEVRLDTCKRLVPVGMTKLYSVEASVRGMFVTRGVETGANPPETDICGEPEPDSIPMRHPYA